MSASLRRRKVMAFEEIQRSLVSLDFESFQLSLQARRRTVGLDCWVEDAQLMKGSASEKGEAPEVSSSERAPFEPAAVVVGDLSLHGQSFQPGRDGAQVLSGAGVNRRGPWLLSEFFPYQNMRNHESRNAIAQSSHC